MSIDAIRCPKCGSEDVDDFPNPHDAVYYGHYRLRCRTCQHNRQATLENKTCVNCTKLLEMVREFIAAVDNPCCGTTKHFSRLVDAEAALRDALAVELTEEMEETK